ncbi:hypothetical protein CALCODRAFT_488636, partial [Calocera cornea HHB12733]
TLAPPSTTGAKKRKSNKENAAPDESTAKRARKMPERQTDNSVNLKAATTKKPKATEMLKEAEKRILEAETRILEANAKLAASEAKLALTEGKLQKALKKKKKEVKLIPKPTGQAASKKGYQLQTAMLLKDDKKTYNFLVDTVHAAFHQSGAPVKPRITDYTVTEMNSIFTFARLKAPALAAYAGEWATRDILKQYTKNLNGGEGQGEDVGEGQDQDQDQDGEDEDVEEEEEEDDEEDEDEDEDDEDA